jgi:hypothetical protein
MGNGSWVMEDEEIFDTRYSIFEEGGRRGWGNF